MKFFFKNSYNIISTLFFVFAIILAHLFATNNYDWTKNTISDLGSQGYERKIIMQLGFLAFGLIISIGILLNGLTWRQTPIFIYGLSVGMTGIFCTKPFFHLETYSTFQSQIHSVLAQIAGITFSISMLVQAFYSTDKIDKLIHFIFFILVIVFSIMFGLLKNYQGIAQRLLYLTSFIWLIKFYRK